MLFFLHLSVRFSSESWVDPKLLTDFYIATLRCDAVFLFCRCFVLKLNSIQSISLKSMVVSALEMLAFLA
jgi:hypothetical protein